METGVPVMDDKAILRAALKERKMTQAKLAEKLGMLQTAVSANMTRDRMSMDTFRSVLDKLNYDIVVVARENGEQKWVVDPTR